MSLDQRWQRQHRAELTCVRLTRCNRMRTMFWGLEAVANSAA